MKYLTDKKIALVIIAACLLFLFLRDSAEQRDANITESRPAGETVEFARPAPRSFQERVIYTCRLGDEEIPAVQISEAADENGEATETIARAALGNGIEMAAPGVGARWDYKSVSARAEGSVIDIAYKPEAARGGYDWVLTLSGNGTFIRERVKDCTEVSDE